MCAVRFVLVTPAAQVWHAVPGQKNRKVLAQLVYKVLVSVKFNMALFSIAGRQVKATQQLKEEVEWFLDRCAAHPDAIIRHYASDMRLQLAVALHSYGTYLSEPSPKSRAAGHYCLFWDQLIISASVEDLGK